MLLITLITFVGYTLVSVFVLLFVYTLWQSFYWYRYGVQGPKGWPICGNMWEFLIGRKHYGDVYESLYNSFSGMSYVGIYRLFNEPAILLRNPQLVKDVLIKNFHNFENNVLWVDPKRDALVHCNPFIAKDEHWKQRRNEFVPIFTASKVKASFAHMKASCLKLESFVEHNLPANCFDAKDLFSKYTLTVIASAAFSIDAEAFTNKRADFTNMVESFFQPHSFSLLHTIALLFSSHISNLIKYYYAPLKVQNWLRIIMIHILDERLNGNDVRAPTDFIQWLLEAKDKYYELNNREVIIGHASTFILEGFETSSSLMAFACFEFARNPAIQCKIQNEIDKILEYYNGELCYEAVQKMTYLEAALYETLRLYPAMVALLKHCTKSFELPAQTDNNKPFDVPVGMVMVVPVQALHKDPNIYPQPNRFLPERFLDGNQRLSCTYLGFGEGPRMCPGLRFGLAQSKAGLAALLVKYTITLNAKTKLPLQLATTTFLTTTKHGIWINFTPRNK